MTRADFTDAHPSAAEFDAAIAKSNTVQEALWQQASLLRRIARA